MEQNALRPGSKRQRAYKSGTRPKPALAVPGITSVSQIVLCSFASSCVVQAWAGPEPVRLAQARGAATAAASCAARGARAGAEPVRLAQARGAAAAGTLFGVGARKPLGAAEARTGPEPVLLAQVQGAAAAEAPFGVGALKALGARARTGPEPVLLAQARNTAAAGTLFGVGALKSLGAESRTGLEPVLLAQARDAAAGAGEDCGHTGSILGTLLGLGLAEGLRTFSKGKRKWGKEAKEKVSNSCGVTGGEGSA